MSNPKGKFQKTKVTSDKKSSVFRARTTHPVSRNAILKMYDDGWTPAEISQKLNISQLLVTDTIANILKRTA